MDGNSIDKRRVTCILYEMDGSSDADAHFALGNRLADEGKPDAALAAYDRAIAAQPNYAAAHNNRGNLFARARRFEEALSAYENASMLAPDNAVFASNRGAMLYHLARYEEARACYDQAMTLDPHHTDARINRGQLLTDMRQFDAAQKDFDHVLEHVPEHAHAHWNRALLSLVQGDFAQGWQDYEWRWEKSPFKEKQRHYTQPLWLGETPLAGKTLLIHPEQGAGDFLQFCRYVPLLEAQGANVILETPAPLMRLMPPLNSHATIIKEGDPLPPFDLHCPIMSLPLAMGTTLETIPGTVPYLAVDAQTRARWQARLGPKTRPRIGLVWSGAAGHVNDHNRSIALERFAPLLALPLGIHSLQRDVRPEDKLSASMLISHADAIADFADTAALIEEMDVIICVDTATAHLAGALGKPTWLLVPYAPDFRWLLARDDSPWYPSMRLFRQASPGAWYEVIARVKHAVEEHFSLMPAQHSPHRMLIDEAFAEAVTSQQAGDYTVAEALYEEILKLDPLHLKSLMNLSSLYLREHRLEQALIVVERALAIDESQAVLHYNYGRILMQARMQDEALMRYDRAIELSPDTAVFYSNRGIAYYELNRYEEAIASYTEAITRDPSAAEYYNNRGNALTHVLRMDEAIADYARAVALSNGKTDANYNWALIELMQGAFAEGWKRHEARWEKPNFAVDCRALPEPLWLGAEPVAGKTILIYPEQGLGDIIQFSRYVPLLEARGANVILEVSNMLVAQMRTLSPTVTVIAKHETPPPYDLQCPIMSLPLAFGTTLETIPAQVPYLSVLPEKRMQWQTRLGAKTRPRIGLVWSGSPTHLNDRNRSIPLKQLRPLLTLPYEFHSLQLEVRSADRPYLQTILQHADEIRDFTDTAALIEAMDLVISVDTSVAHLAGALGVPLWMMIPYIPDFRWLLGREDSPWYPTARVFRQPANEDWAHVIEQLIAALQRAPW